MPTSSRTSPADGGRRPRPLDPAGLDQLALHYVGRYATTRARLEAYLARKLAERGWAGDAPPRPEAIVARFVSLGYVDDRAFAAMRAAALGRRGYGGRRIESSLRAAGVDDADRAPARPSEEEAWAAALALARRRRIGPYGPPAADRADRERAIAILVRAGHDYDIARQVAALRSEAATDQE